MNRQMAEMMFERLLFVIGFLARRFIGDGDVAEHARRIVGPAWADLQRRKRQHVGRLVDATPIAVQGANAGVVGQHDRDFGFAGIRIGDLGPRQRRRAGYGLGIRLALPAVGDNENLGYGKGKSRHRSGISVAARKSPPARARRKGFASGLAGCRPLRHSFIGRDDPRHQFMADHVFRREFHLRNASTPSSSLVASARPEVWPGGRSTWLGSPVTIMRLFSPSRVKTSSSASR